ncbi:uncharacterized protein LOC144437494 [Glandiceps talaboti]
MVEFDSINIANRDVTNIFDKCELFLQIDGIQRDSYGYTATIDAALRKARSVLINSRPDVRKIMFLITTGKSNIGEHTVVVRREIQSLMWDESWNSQLDVFALGIGEEVDTDDLESIASNSRFALYIDTVDKFKDLTLSLNEDKVEIHWEVVESEKCLPLCSNTDTCMCCLDTGNYQCVGDMGYQGNRIQRDVCQCNLLGTVNASNVCENDNSQCPCKPNTYTRDCSQCRDETYMFPTNADEDCLPCGCDYGGSASFNCDKVSGLCDCRPNVTGQYCNQVDEGFYYTVLDSNSYDAWEIIQVLVI